MNKQIALLLLCLHLAGNTEAGQLFRMPMLMQHFYEHQKKEPNISLAQFLVLHYAIEEKAGTEHKNLPFHDYSHSSVATVYAPMINLNFSDFTILYPSSQEKSLLKERIYSTYTDRILRPPIC